MYFAIECRDKPDHAQVRTENRPAHLDYLKSQSDSIVFAGPLTDDAGETMLGSLLVIEAESRKQVEDFCAGDPYAKAGLFAETKITAWKRVIG